MPSCTYSCERNHRPPAHSLFATLDPLLPVPVMAELLEYCRKETMGEETSFAHSCNSNKTRIALLGAMQHLQRSCIWLHG